ncbi:MAG: SIMPL domain-containing protein [Paludibacteraceae bacterium]|nr:SIMPL domain-containing protein [Paludibacteraceae bacterium]
MKNNLLAALCVALGLTLCGLCIGGGITKMANKDHHVTVKGLATRTVEADHAVWPLHFGIAGNDLQSLYTDRERVSREIHNLLIKQGFAESDIRDGNVSVENNWSNYYGDHRPEHHYSLSASVVVSTDDVMRVVNSRGCESSLLNQGIIVNTHDWQVEYQYNGLAELKPEMIEEATKNARAVAQKFADDADCRLGRLTSASQGQFSIESDEFQPWIKYVRVVTTVNYQLD